MAVIFPRQSTPAQSSNELSFLVAEAISNISSSGQDMTFIIIIRNISGINFDDLFISFSIFLSTNHRDFRFSAWSQTVMNNVTSETEEFLTKTKLYIWPIKANQRFPCCGVLLTLRGVPNVKYANPRKYSNRQTTGSVLYKRRVERRVSWKSFSLLFNIL